LEIPNRSSFWEEYEKGKIVFGDDEKTVPRIRTNLFENSNQVMTSVHYSYAQTAANEFSTLFDGERVFSPKPVNDIKSLIAYLSNTDDLIVDFCWLRHIWAFSFFTKCKRSC
jgi:adenine-specific DNA-methyltransferase